MRIRAVVAIALCLLGASTQGCDSGDTPRAAAAPGTHPERPDSGTSKPPPPPPPPPPSDGGSSDADARDASAFDLDSGQLVTECDEITAVPFIGEDTTGAGYANAIEAPSDLGATRIVATWSGSCEPAAVKIEMTDGDCPSGDGHGLTFLLDALAIRDGVLGIGIHELVPESAGGPIKVRYVRPARRDPAGEWGTCDGVGGTLSIAGQPGIGRRDELQALFEMQLAPCDGSGQPNQTVRGTFNVMLRRSLEDVCPP